MSYKPAEARRTPSIPNPADGVHADVTLIHLDMQMLEQTWPLKWADRNNGPRIMETCSKPCRYFVHRFNLLFLFWFINCCILCAWSLCYCCCPLAVCLHQLRLILPGVDWTLQMSVYNLLILFMSACRCWCVCVSVCVGVCVVGRLCQRQMGVGGCVYVLEMSRSHLHWSPHPAGRGEGPSLVHLLFLSLFFSHMLEESCPYCSPSDWSLSLPISSFAPQPGVVTCFSESVDLLPSTHSLSISVFGCFLLFCLFLFHNHSLRILFNLLFTHSFCSISILSCFSHCLSGSVNSKSHLPK